MYAQARIAFGRIFAALEELARAHGEVFRGIAPQRRVDGVRARRLPITARVSYGSGGVTVPLMDFSARTVPPPSTILSVIDA
jgi:hypothetical protein